MQKNHFLVLKNSIIPKVPSSGTLKRQPVQSVDSREYDTQVAPPFRNQCMSGHLFIECRHLL